MATKNTTITVSVAGSQNYLPASKTINVSVITPNGWDKLTDTDENINANSKLLVHNNTLYSHGYNKILKFNKNTSTWEIVNALGSGMAATSWVSFNGDIYLSGSIALGKIDEEQQKTIKIENIPNLDYNNFDYYDYGMVNFNNKLYIFISRGSRTSSSGRVGKIYTYDTNGLFQEITDAPFEYSTKIFFVLNNKIYHVRGTNEETAMYTYDGNSWTKLADTNYIPGGYIVYKNQLHAIEQRTSKHYIWNETNLNFELIEDNTPINSPGDIGVEFDDKMHILNFNTTDNLYEHYTWKE